MTIKIGILGYGNLGRGVEAAVHQNADMKLVGIFTRRDPVSLHTATQGVAVRSADDLLSGDRLDIDVLVICAGSATDLPEMTPRYARRYNVVDSFDTHAHIPDHFSAVDAVAGEAGTLALISAGWDPGLFSLNRLFGNAFIPEGKDYTFWGRGVSQGHSDAVRRIEGVADARQYTVPVESALEEVRAGKNPELITRQKHTREVYVVAEEGADRDAITEEITTMPNYFDEYDTTVHFISQEEMDRDHSQLPHGGFVLRSGKMASGAGSVIEYSLKLDSNPDFTSSVLLAYARAVARMSAEGQKGCRTVFDVAPSYLSPHDNGYLRSHYL
ncbi:MAG: diaminopimelate dehydrogenase [Bifidobacteriaceae bacterium]|jgi:diaminopimelate dehydrogenase|nr:diaminopimelate dehydrogenase [Bifidobacteriaceae bacterium]MCI1979648.1 diaminopimelate dehydrogenase [Bifidobacteriaceae bacterium]